MIINTILLLFLVAVSIATSIAVSACRFARLFRLCQTIRENNTSTAETQRARRKALLDWICQN